MMNRVVLAGLRSPLHMLLDGGTVGLRYLSVGGAEVTLPVAFVKSGTELVVLVGGSPKKRWWRHFLTRQPLEVWWHGAWRLTTAKTFVAGAPEQLAAAAAYAARHPRAQTSHDPVVLVTIPSVSDTVPPPPTRS
jgi:hypothetical protein